MPTIESKTYVKLMYFFASFKQTSLEQLITAILSLASVVSRRH